MKFSQVQKFALSLPEVTEEPHFQRTSFRVKGKIIATAIPGEEFLNVMLSDSSREPLLNMYANCVEPLYWGKKVMGVRVSLSEATHDIVKELLEKAWGEKAPKALVAASRGSAL